MEFNYRKAKEGGGNVKMFGGMWINLYSSTKRDFF